MMEILSGIKFVWNKERHNMLNTLIDDVKQCDGQKLEDYEQMTKDIILFDYWEEYSFLLYIEKLRKHSMLDEIGG